MFVIFQLHNCFFASKFKKMWYLAILADSQVYNKNWDTLQLKKKTPSYNILFGLVHLLY